MTLEVDFSALLQEVAEHPTPDNVGRAFAAALDRRENPERYPHKPLSVVVCPHCEAQRWDGQGPCGTCGLLLDEPVTYTDEIGKMVIEAAERDAIPEPTPAAALLPPRTTALHQAIGYPDPPPLPQPIIDPYAPPLDSRPETADGAGPVPSESRLPAAPPAAIAPPTSGSVPSPGQKPSALSGEGYSTHVDDSAAFASQVADALSRLSPNADPELLQAHQRPPVEFADDDSDVTGWILLAGRNAGKALAYTTPLPTPTITGWTTVGDVEIGDCLFDEHGRLTTVTGIYEVSPSRTIRLHFSDRTFIDACDEHRWVAMTHSDIRRLRRHQLPIPRDWATNYPERTTLELLALLNSAGSGEAEVMIPLVDPLELPERDLPIDPWLLGFWLGNGVRGTSRITMHRDDERYVRTRITTTTEFKLGEDCPSAPSRPNYSPDFSVYGLITALKALGIDREKSVPPVYLRASTPQRMALLAGLLDSDGYIGRSGIEFCSTDEALAVAVADLARSLGEMPVVIKSIAKLYGVEKGPKYRVTWRPRINPFESPRKASCFRSPTNRHYRKLIRYEILPPVPMRCFTVENAHGSHMYLAGEAMIPTHNTYAGVRELDRQMRRSPNRRARIIAPTFQDAVASCVDGPSGVLAATNNEVVWKPSHPGGAQLRWPNGSICYVIGTPTPREVDRLRAVGNIDFDMFEEAAANTQLLEVERQARLSRRRKGAKWIATTTPRPLPTIRQWQKDPHVAVSSATAHSNRFADTLWLEELERMYAGTRLYAQEVEGRVLEDVEGALWNITHLDRSRVSDLPTFYAMLEAQGRQVSRSAVGVDPAASTGTTGIVAVAMTDDRHLFVVEDASAPGRSAESWARVAVDTALRWNAPIIPENDQGGDMVRAVLKAADLQDEVTILPARARGVGSKGVRAEPIALLWEREDFRGHLVGYFPALETELTSFVPDAPGQDSPDRLDAMVWACTYLWSRASFGDVTSSWPNSAYGKPGAVQMRRPGEVLPWRRSHKSRKETQT